MPPLLPRRPRRLRCRSTSCLLCVGLIALYHSLLAGLLMHYWVTSSAGLQHEKLELVERVSELSGRVSALQQEASAKKVQQQQLAGSTDSLQANQAAPKALRAAHSASASAPPASRCSQEASATAPAPDPKALSESVIIVGDRTRITLLTAATLRLEHLSGAAPAGRFDDRASFAFVNRRLAQCRPATAPPAPPALPALLEYPHCTRHTLLGARRSQAAAAGLHSGSRAVHAARAEHDGPRGGEGTRRARQLPRRAHGAPPARVPRSALRDRCRAAPAVGGRPRVRLGGAPLGGAATVAWPDGPGRATARHGGGR